MNSLKPLVVKADLAAQEPSKIPAKAGISKSKKMNLWYVYIMTNRPNGVLYIGVTDNIDERVKEHKLRINPKAFTAKYNCDKLVYFEEFDDGFKAAKRERQFKKLKRAWKIELIEEMNPNWTDLSLNWNLNFNKIRE